MNYRTTVLAGTFAVICAAGDSTAQTARRPRIAIIPAAPAPTVQARQPMPRYYPQQQPMPQYYPQQRPMPQYYPQQQPMPQYYPQQQPMPQYSSRQQPIPQYSSQQQPMQQYSSQQRPMPRSSAAPRIGWIVPPPPVLPEQNGAQTAGFANGAPQVAAFYYLPAVILTDGRVFADFNGIYEQVLRRCPITSGPVPPGFATPACWVVDSYGRYQVIQRR